MKVTNYCVGELSNADTQALVKLAPGAHRVLEFGSGGSTMLWAQFCPPGRTITSVETVAAWMDRTRNALERLGCELQGVRFVPFEDWRGALGRQPWFDLIFIDGATNRIDVAERAWDLLVPAGRMAWHDTHTGLGEEVFHWMARKHQEISQVVNEAAVTIATKCVPINIGNTDAFECREEWESGHASLPPDWPKPR